MSAATSPGTVERAIAIVGVGAVLPDAPNVDAFWNNLTGGRYSISDVDPARWNPDFYFDPDRQATDKTYSKIGGWVRDWDWSPLEWRLPIPPKVAAAMDRTQQWAVSAARQALADYGHPDKPLDHDRTAVVLGNAMGGDLHYLTALSVYFPEYADELQKSPSFAALPPDVQATIVDEMRTGMQGRFPDITEDTMPGELANIIAGRLANLFDFHGPNFIVDAACASAMAAIDAAVEGLEEGAYDAVLTGGVDANMSASTFVKFCKIGALSATGTRPFGEGADGFVMGEGAALFLLKRLADAEAAGDHIYAVLRGIGGASDGKGKGITAPNPVGQRLAVIRAWRNAGTAPDTATMIEAHGTSTKVGDVVESQSIADAFGDFDLPVGSLALGSVKSNIGHLKGAAGAAGMLKAALSLDNKIMPPSLNATTPNPNIDFGSSPLRVNTELRDWEANGHLRTAGVSAFGFGGTNFHMVLEEHVPGRLTAQRSTFAVGAEVTTAAPPAATAQANADLKAPMRGLAVVGGASSADVVGKLTSIRDAAAKGNAPSPAPPADADLRADVRVAIDYADAADLAAKAGKAISALESNNSAAWKLLRNQGVFHGEGPAHQLAMLYTGQGSQYVNMLAELRATEPIVGATFDEADRIMEPLIGRPLTDIIFVDPDDEAAVAEANQQLMQTEITQPAVLTVDLALTRLFQAYGVEPDMVMGHSLGEYGALVASGALPFADALEAVSARGREMANVSVDDNGLMAAVFAPMTTIEETIAAVDDYVVVANINSGSQAVIGGSTPGVEAAAERLVADGHQVVMLPVSHAFHTSIVAPAAEPLGDVLRRLDVQPPTVPTVANVSGEFYPMGPAVVPDMINILRQQIASPVQFIKGLETLYDAGARVFVEVGPKRALHGFVDEVLANDDSTVLPLFSNHPKNGDVASFNQALAGLYASGHGVGTLPAATAGAAIGGAAPGAPAQTPAPATAEAAPPVATPAAATAAAAPAAPAPAGAAGTDRYMELGRLFADVLERGYEVLGGAAPSAATSSRGDGVVTSEPVVVTGAALGLPGTEQVFDDGNLARLLDGESFIDAIPVACRQAIVDKKITRLVKNESGGGSWEVIQSQHDVVKLAGQRGELDLVEDFGMSAERVAALDSSSELAIGAGIDALRDAGIPLTMHYKATTTGGTLPDRWGLPDSMRDDTGIIFASAFPGLDNMTREVTAYQRDLSRRERLADLEHLRDRISDDDPAMPELEHMIQKVHAEMDAEPYEFNRRFLFRILSMGHSQFAEHIGARGPNTQVNAACASTTQAVSMAEDWIRLGRCRRVLIISGDEATNESLMEWIGAGFLASGAAATDEVVEEAALPFDKRRHGMLIGMGAAAIVVERADSARERGIRPIADVLGGVTANSAFHGSRLDVDHICQVMEGLVADVERRWGVSRSEIARNGVFVSHETYTPARGGSAQAEVNALRTVFGADADRLVVANTKGFTGHAMGVGVEDVLAVKALETGVVPPIANVKEIDPDLGHLNLSKGGAYPVRYALRLGAGFGSQISMSLMRWTPPADGRHREPAELGFGYRIDDPAAWQRFLEESSGYDDPQLEVVSRALRVRDDGPPAKRPVRAEKPVAKAPEVVNAPPIEPPIRTAAVPAAAAGVNTGGAAPAAVPAATAGAPTSGAAPAAPPAPASDPVVDQVLEIVAEQTGYPSDMLDLDLDLEADLGIDTVKQAETFAAIREHYDIERDDNLSLRDYPTLASVVGFVRDRAVGLPEVATATAPPVATPAVAAGGAAPATPAPAAADEVVDQVMAVVAEQTGYPADMLELDLDLEADLGIDTVKQAETFAAIREHYGIERDDNLSLRDYPTLGHVVGFVRERAVGLPDVAPAAAPAGATGAAPATPAPAAADEVVDQVLSVVAEQTGYPADMLELDLDLEADLGIDTVKQAETFAAIREHYGIERDDNLSLRDYPTLGHVVGFVRERAKDLPSAPAAAPAAAPAPAAPAAPAAAPTSSDPVVDQVLAVVAEQTGYPADMLELDLDLEADLGIDTVKQAETFAAIREHYDIERDDNLSLRDYPTLASVVGFVRERAAGLPEAAPAAAPTGTTGAASATPAPAAADEVVDQVLAVVAEQTGYPADMLELDLDLEADLGIDTVKQAETFAAIREHYDIERDDNLSLRDYPTLGHVVGFVRERAPHIATAGEATGGAAPAATPASATETAAPAAPGAPAAAAPAASASTGLSLYAGDDAATDALRRRLPAAVVRPPLDWCIETGIALDEGAPVVVMADEGGVAAALVGRLESRGVDVLFVEDHPDTEAFLERIDEWLDDRTLRGVYWLPALDADTPIADQSIDEWREGLRIRVKMLFRLLRHRYDDFVEGTFLVSATRLGGRHGYEPGGASNPMGGGVVGLTKSFRRERPDVMAKAVDFAPSRKTAALADLLIDETLRDPGAIEIGWRDEERCAIALVDRPVPTDEDNSIEFGSDTTFVITGAAGSIVSAIIGDLAGASGGTFHLLDLAPAPDPDDADVLAFEADRDALKMTIFERMKAAGERATPAIVEKELSGIERRHAALAALQAIEHNGGTAHYHQVDLRDPVAMAAVMADVVDTSGSVDALIHAGGLEISKSMPDKSPEEYDLVFDVKADGWFNLIHGLAGTDLGSAVVFSSIAGRFGNAGQPDYSAANDLLCKQSSSIGALYDGAFGVAIDWTAWGDIGMATRGSIPQIMAAAGIDMLPAAAGIPVVRHELTAGGASRELVVAGRLGVMAAELAPDGGLATSEDSPVGERLAGLATLDTAKAISLDDGLVASGTLDPMEQPFLNDHRIDGTAVLPGVMGVESFAAAATLLAPDHHVVAIDDVDFLAPFKFFRDESREIVVTAQLVPGDDGEITAHCALIGQRILANQPEPQTTVHFTGAVRLRQGDGAADLGSAPVPDDGDVEVEADDIYRIYFHGPAYQVLDEAWIAGTQMCGEWDDDVPAATDPADARLVTAPRWLELCFQTAGVWEIGTSGEMALPNRIDHVEFGQPETTIDGAVAVVDPATGDDGAGHDAVVVDADGNVLVRMTGYRTIRLPGALDDDLVAPLRRATTPGDQT